MTSGHKQIRSMRFDQLIKLFVGTLRGTGRLSARCGRRANVGECGAGKCTDLFSILTAMHFRLFKIDNQEFPIDQYL
jgi:hypothetical protein